MDEYVTWVRHKIALPYFASLGYNCPVETNPAEFVVDLVSIDTDTDTDVDYSSPPQIIAVAQDNDDEARIERLANAFQEYNNNQKNNGGKQQLGGSGIIGDILFRVPSSSIIVKDEESSKQQSKEEEGDDEFSLSTWIRHIITRFGLLLQRSWRQNVRNHQVNAVRLFVSAGNAYFFTNVFHSITKGQPYYLVSTVPDRTALLSFGVINMAMMTVMKTIDLFAKEKPVVLREQQRRQYTSLEYLLSKTLAEIPLDIVFAIIFTLVLKSTSAIRISFVDLTAVFSLMTFCGASLGFAIGACTPTADVALSVGVPLMVLMLGVGVITPTTSVVDDNNENDDNNNTGHHHPSIFVTILKHISPIAYAIRAVCIKEYDGMEFYDPMKETKDKTLIGRLLFRPVTTPLRLVRNVFRMGGLALVKHGEEILMELGIDDETFVGSMIHLAVLSLLFLFVAWMGLMWQQQQHPYRSKG